MTTTALSAAAPPMTLHVMKRDGSTVAFDRTKIESAILRCYMDAKVSGPDAGQSTAVRSKARSFTEQVLAAILARPRATIQIEDIQDLVEQTLMKAGEHTAAREYVLFRDRQAAERRAAEQVAPAPVALHYTLADGSKAPLDADHLYALAREAAVGLPEVNADGVVVATLRQLFDGCSLKDVDDALVLVARQHVEEEPTYSQLAARLLLSKMRREVYGQLQILGEDSQKGLAAVYSQILQKSLSTGVEACLFDVRLLDGRFDLVRLGDAIRADRDFQFDLLGLQTLYDRYFVHVEDVRIELPQTFFMRVAMGLSLNEAHPTETALAFYELMSSFDYMSSTPTLFNAGTSRPQLSSCFLTSVPDDLDGIFGAIHNNAMLSKFAGGLGNDWTPVRSIGSRIKGTNGKSSGVVPFLKVANDTAVAVNQGGRRKGAVCAYLETWHRDIEEFLDLRKNTGDDRRRTHDMNTCNWVPDLFMERVLEDGSWTLFSPNEVPDLHDLYGEAFRLQYEAYEAQAAAGQIKVFKQIKAVDLWRKMLGMLFETGHPWITFKDPCNLRSPQQHVGVVHSSNLCTEITLNTSPGEEIAVCNLGSINAAAHFADGAIDHVKLRKSVRTAMRMLDDVIDVNYYTVDAARRANQRHRPVGLGIMGFQDALYKLKFAYASPEAVRFADELMESVSYYAIEASADLARERGSYESFDGSLWSKGVLPIDSIELLKANRKPGHLELNMSVQSTLDWEALRHKVRGGMRNSNCMAIAPTATISNIVGVSQSIEPMFENLFVESNMSGEFTSVNTYLVDELKALGLWDKVMIQDLKYFDGSVQRIGRVPEDLKRRFATAFEIDPKWLIEAASRRQKWIDQAQSLNLYMAQPNGKALSEMYQFAWKRGLKTTYYLRSVGASRTEKSTVDNRQLNAVQMAPQAQVCSIDSSCEACQ